MATVRPYINHLLQNTGITPACSEEERTAADDIAQIFARHGFEPEIQEFTASGSFKLAYAVLGIMSFVAAVLMGLGGALGVIGLLLAVAAAVLFYMERIGKPVLSKLGAGGISQNVIAYHKASGPLASPRNRPVVVVAHYDSPRADVLSQMPYAAYRPVLVKLLPYAMVVPAIVAIVRLLPLPDAAKIVLWILGIIVALVPLANAVATIMNRYVLPYTSGSVCNKSSVAAMLGVMNAVAPFTGENEFPEDIPFEEYFAEQQEIAEDQARAAAGDEADEEGAAGDEPAEGDAPVEGDDLSADAMPAESEAGASSDLSATASMAVPASAASSTAELGADAVAAIAAAGVEATEAALDQVVGENEGNGSVDAEAAAPASKEDGDASGRVDVSGDDEVRDAGDSSPSGAGSAKHGEPVDHGEPADGASPADDASAAGEQGMPRDLAEEPSTPINALGNYRYGTEAIRALGMVPDSCVIEYEADAFEKAPSTRASGANVAGDARDTSATAHGADDANAARDERGDADSASAVHGAGEVDGATEGSSHLDEDERDFGSFDTDAYGYEDEQREDEREGDWDEIERPRPPRRRPHPAVPAVPAGGAAGVADALSALGAGAQRLFGAALRRGKSMVDVVEQSISDAKQHARHDDDAVDEANAAELESGAAQDQLEQAGASADGAGLTDDASADSDATSAQQALDETASMSAPTAAMDVSDLAAAAQESQESQESQGAASAVSPASAPEAAGADVRVDGQSGVDLGATHAYAPSQVPGVQDLGAPTSSAPGAQAAHEQTGAPAASEEPQAETVDSLMEQIYRAHPQPRQQRQSMIGIPDPSQPSLNRVTTASRTSLFDIPDPLSTPADPFAPQGVSGVGGVSNSTPAPSAAPIPDQPAPISPASIPDPFSPAPVVPASGAAEGFSVIGSADGAQPVAAPSLPVISAPAPATASGAVPSAGASSPMGAFETISADAPMTAAQHEGKKRRGLFGRKKKQEETSMSEFLGVGDDFDAKRSGRDIGSWDNFDSDWKGGAATAGDADESELRDAVASMGDDELLGHDIWFVATGASEFGNAGMKAFLEAHRDKLRGVFLINLECVGAGRVVMVASEGENRVLKGDKRIMRLVRKVSSAFHCEYGEVEMSYLSTDAYAAMNMSLRSLTLAGVDGPRFACSHSTEDMPYNVDVENINTVADVVTEVIRRS